MNLLLVDDEVYVVRTLQKKIDWERQGVDRVFTAFNVERAKEIFLRKKSIFCLRILKCQENPACS